MPGPATDDLPARLRELADAVGTNQQYEVHQCHWPDASCVICRAWNELGDARIVLARWVADAVEYVQQLSNHGSAKRDALLAAATMLLDEGKVDKCRCHALTVLAVNQLEELVSEMEGLVAETTCDERPRGSNCIGCPHCRGRDLLAAIEAEALRALGEAG